MKASNGIIKIISSLDKVKNRRDTGLFVAEGTKCVLDLMCGFEPRYIVATEQWLGQKGHALSGLNPEVVLTASPKDMGRMSNLSTPSGVIGVFVLPQRDAVSPDVADSELVLILDDVRDPGNLGTIIRAADWFGIRHIVCSKESVDAFNPKVVMATMGALARVEVDYVELDGWLSRFNGPCYGTFLDGQTIYDAKLEQHGVIVVGNEGSGVSPTVASKCTHRLFIPPYPSDAVTSESLNVGMATSIVLNEFRRRNG